MGEIVTSKLSILEKEMMVEIIAVSGIVVALFMAICYNMVELATSLGSGLVGFIGGKKLAGGTNK